MSRRSKASAVPAFVIPMAAVQVTELPEEPDWLYELKLDGSPYLAGVTGTAAQGAAGQGTFE
jgi:hypothetical protein